MNGIIVVLLVTALLITFFPIPYMIGWLVTLFPMYFGVFKLAVNMAEEESGIQLATSFFRHRDESRGLFVFRRSITFIAWSITSYLVYWILMPFLLFSKTKEIDMAKHIVLGLLT